MQHGDIRWTELNVRPGAAEAAAAFYAKLTRTEVRTLPAPEGGHPYRLLMRGAHAVAGVFVMDGPGFEGMSSHWFGYVEVDDCDAATRLTEAEGGAVRRPPRDVPGVGRIAVIADPSGAVIGLMQPAGDAA